MQAEIGVFGGSGFYAFGADTTNITIATPYGPTSAAVTLTEVAGRIVAFIPRHGVHHEFAPAYVPARANVWAMRELGVRQIIAPCAAGSLSPAVHPGDFVVLDQLVDRTWGRPDTFFAPGERAQHIAFADPYCPVLGGLARRAGERAGVHMHATGTVVVIPGPRFSTRAESHWFRAQGWDVVNMTQYPEAYLARELGIHYAGIALVTDYDTGIEDDPDVQPVTEQQVFGFFEANLHRVRALLDELIPMLPDEPSGCGCVSKADGPSARHG